MEDLVHIVYCSLASAELSPSAVLHMVERAQERNPERGISGMLVFGNQRFLQMIEGPRRAVSDLYHTVVRDPRHTDLVLIDFAYKPARDFGRWGMALYDASHSDDPSLKKLSSKNFDPYTFNRRNSLEVLHRAADRMAQGVR
jgi:hypothetical protein